MIINFDSILYFKSANFSFLDYQHNRYKRSYVREILSFFITNLTVSDKASISLINTVLESLTQCPEEISRVMAVKFEHY